MNHVLRASVLLGKIMNLHNQLHLPRESDDFITQFTTLETAASLFSLAASLPHGDAQGIEQGMPDLRAWLIVVLQICNIFLFHPTASDSIPGTPTPNPDPESTPGFQYCINAVRHIVKTLKWAASKSNDALENPFLVLSYYMCCRFLSIGWRLHQSKSDRDDIDFILMLINHLEERSVLVARKYRKAILRDLGKSLDAIRMMRVGTGKYIDDEFS